MPDLDFSVVYDSHYSHVKSRVLASNSARKFGGVMDAQEWPVEEVLLEAFYLLTLGEVPVYNLTTPSIPSYAFSCQWSWIIVGTDITSGVQGSNRGDRYRIHNTMKNELRQAMFPLFTEKKIHSADSFGNVIKTSFSPQEFINWGPFVFNSRRDKASGVIYGIASVNIASITQEVLV